MLKYLSARGFFCLAMMAASVWPVCAQSTAKETTTQARGVYVWVADTAQKDQSTGWADILTPGAGFRFNNHFAVDATVPWYPVLQALVPSTVNGTTTDTLETKHNVLGDASASAHADANMGNFGYSAMATVGFPTGDTTLGLSTGTTTYHFNNHLEYSLGHFNPDVEAGIGNSTNLASMVVKKAYAATGAVANFQAGVDVDLPRKSSLDIEGYEVMPLATQTVFGTMGRSGMRGRGSMKQVLQGTTGAAEDNGLMVELGVPLTNRLTMVADYNRSIIQDDWIAGFGITWHMGFPMHAATGETASPTR